MNQNRKSCLKQWQYYYENPLATKEDYIKQYIHDAQEAEDFEIFRSCYACIESGLNCHDCPINWNEPKTHVGNRCTHSKSPYYLFDKASKAGEYNTAKYEAANMIHLIESTWEDDSPLEECVPYREEPVFLGVDMGKAIKQPEPETPEYETIIETYINGNKQDAVNMINMFGPAAFIEHLEADEGQMRLTDKYRLLKSYILITNA